jgi:hypothetical protein
VKEYLVKITNDASHITILLNQGWMVDSVTAGHVAACAGNIALTKEVYGNFCFILSRDKAAKR